MLKQIENDKASTHKFPQYSIAKTPQLLKNTINQEAKNLREHVMNRKAKIMKNCLKKTVLE